MIGWMWVGLLLMLWLKLSDLYCEYFLPNSGYTNSFQKMYGKFFVRIQSKKVKVVYKGRSK